ncbi:MAG: SDR family oxidoreductase [Candidatus Rokubacteria bacterium]|nr:SDR family oxidoreductase [Candidatus Rokubacteria bacterium]
MASVTWDMRGTVVVVTGGTRGIGRGIVEAFAGAGATVWMGSRDAKAGEAVARRIRATGRAIRFQPLDVADRTSVRAFRDACLRQAEHIDVLVNNAGVMARKALLETTEEECDGMLDTNVKGVILCCQAVGEAMIAAKSGRIINISSTSGSAAAWHSTVYGATKAAISQFTRMLALEWAPHGIRVNAIAPGAVPTDLNANVMAIPEQRQAILARTPLGRMGTPADIAGVALFMASPAADYLTGQIIFVDGGRMVT